MNETTKENLKLVGVPSALALVALGVGILVSPNLVVPPAPTPKAMLVWSNAPDAVLTDIWERDTINGPERLLGRVTNQQTFNVICTNAQRFYRVSHPITNGHYWDDGWRVNHAMWQLQ